MLTQTAKYAVRALIFMAEQQSAAFQQTNDIAKATGIPTNYLGKTLQKLAHGRVLDSQKGLHGGFRLARPAAEIAFYDILIAIDAIPRDFLSDPANDPSLDLPSAFYAKFGELTALYSNFLKNTTLADLLDPSQVALN
jgi:Rrf2 family protein